MPVESANLGIHLYHAEASAQLQALFATGDRATVEVASAHSQDRAKAEAEDQVQDSKATENPEIQGEEAGAHQHTLAEGEEKEEGKEEAAPPPDPGGRGKIIDVRG